MNFDVSLQVLTGSNTEWKNFQLASNSAIWNQVMEKSSEGLTM